VLDQGGQPRRAVSDTPDSETVDSPAHGEP
jgi:hypothetical protein